MTSPTLSKQGNPLLVPEGYPAIPRPDYRHTRFQWYKIGAQPESELPCAQVNLTVLRPGLARVERGGNGGFGRADRGGSVLRADNGGNSGGGDEGGDASGDGFAVAVVTSKRKVSCTRGVSGFLSAFCHRGAKLRAQRFVQQATRARAESDL